MWALETVQEPAIPGNSRAERFLAWLRLGDRATPIARGEATDSALVPRDEVDLRAEEVDRGSPQRGKAASFGQGISAVLDSSQLNVPRTLCLQWRNYDGRSLYLGARPGAKRSCL